MNFISIYNIINSELLPIENQNQSYYKSSEVLSNIYHITSNEEFNSICSGMTKFCLLALLDGGLSLEKINEFEKEYRIFHNVSLELQRKSVININYKFIKYGWVNSTCQNVFYENLSDSNKFISKKNTIVVIFKDYNKFVHYHNIFSFDEIMNFIDNLLKSMIPTGYNNSPTFFNLRNSKTCFLLNESTNIDYNSTPKENETAYENIKKIYSEKRKEFKIVKDGINDLNIFS